MATGGGLQVRSRRLVGVGIATSHQHVTYVTMHAPETNCLHDEDLNG
jgi:alkylhydroperoxidase/carboxymuconolactone decarboxylase family protein YurZ